MKQTLKVHDFATDWPKKHQRLVAVNPAGEWLSGYYDAEAEKVQEQFDYPVGCAMLNDKYYDFEDGTDFWQGWRWFALDEVELVTEE